MLERHSCTALALNTGAAETLCGLGLYSDHRLMQQLSESGEHMRLQSHVLQDGCRKRSKVNRYEVVLVPSC